MVHLSIRVHSIWLAVRAEMRQRVVNDITKIDVWPRHDYRTFIQIEQICMVVIYFGYCGQ